MSEYYRVLKILAEKKINERMPCTGVNKMQQWYAVILNHSYSEIRIFCKDLNLLNSSFYIESLSNYLNNPWRTIKILLKEDCDLSWLEPLAKYDNLQIRIARGSYSEASAKEFSVADDHAFRFEAKPDFGILNFKDKGASLKLIEAFDEALKFSSAKDIKKVENNNE